MAESSETKPDFVKREEEILAFWKARGVFEESLAQEAPNGEFVFYDGPPFATGLPHHGHLLGSTAKDLFGRYKTMRGYSVRRRWGWDCHGLPIESIVEKQLGLKTKKDIMEVGVKTFNETARGTVLQFVSEWKRYIERLGRWVDFDDSYKTMDATFMESVWWTLKQLHEKGKLYEGRKVLMYCPHCETPLAKAEIAMDNTYKDVIDEAVTVKFKVRNPEKHGLPENTYLLAWTTTPWTLPGNVALAVGPDITYVRIVKAGDTDGFLVAKDLAGSVVSEGKTTDREWSGEELVGIEYEPLYDIPKVAKYEGKKWQVLPADFVTTNEGTGIVHTAVIYGEDDYALGLKEGLPMVPLLNPNGTYNDDAPEFLRGQYFKKANKLVIADLESPERNLLFKKENYTHSYPHCYRCGTALIYNAVSSWFINIQSVKELMLTENERITWVPEHLKHGRFKHIVENAPDWTISRNRFWATPLPIWKDGAGNTRIIGSVEELKKYTKKSGNRYFVMRHGEAEHNTRVLISSNPDDPYSLTDTGKKEVHATALALEQQGITHILHSPFIRAKETTEIVRETLGLSHDQVIEDDRLREINLSTLSGESVGAYFALAPTYEERFSFAPQGGETLNDVRKRVGSLLYDLEKRYTNTTILLVTHEYPAWMLQAVAAGLDQKGAVALRGAHPDFPKTAEAIALPFVPLPHNDEYELDLHRPYIDEVALVDEEGRDLVRIPEVIDCWVESASMPFAEYHYPFEHVREFEKRSPGDFIAEYIAQTRTWFYYMHALSVLLFDRFAFRAVVTTGTVLAGDGSKMSKSKGNYTDPLLNIDRYGADALRFYLMSSVVMQAEDFSFRDEDLKEVHGRVLNMLRNVLAFYELYKEFAPEPSAHSTDVLDQWALLRLTETRDQVTESLDRFDTVKATRTIRAFVDDLSTWYLRRSRDRVKRDDVSDQKAALGTLRFILLELSKLIAPVMPFLAEHVFFAVKRAHDVHSVHLLSWPEAYAVSHPTLLADMAEVRRVVSLALEARSSLGIKVRQPLQTLFISSAPLIGNEKLLLLVKDEVNVKEVIEDSSLGGQVRLDATVTPALKEEGMQRDFVRAVQDLRKQGGFHPGEKAVLTIHTSPRGRSFVEKFQDSLLKTTTLASIVFAELDGTSVSVGDEDFVLSLTR